MNFESVPVSAGNILHQTSIAMIKKTLDSQEEQALQLLKSLPVVTDPALGNIIDAYA